MMRIFFLPLPLFCIANVVVAQEQRGAEDLLRAVTFYASFDEQVAGDFGGGGLLPQTRFNHRDKTNEYVFEEGVAKNVLRIARNRGVSGGALQGVDVLPRRGRILFPAKNNLAYTAGGWGGAVSLWLNTNPNTVLKTSFCDPIQITHRGAHNGGLWIDFPNTKPRDFRLGAFPALREGESPVRESDPQAPLVRVKEIGFKSGHWHHVVMNWKNFDTGRPDAEITLYIDSRPMGRLANRDIAMKWDLARTGIYIGVNYIGLMDELAVFNRPLTQAEITLLRDEPAIVAQLKPRK